MINKQSLSDLEDWNRVASDYAQKEAGTPSGRFDQMFKVLWDCLGDVRGLDVLDLGCGLGWLSKKLSNAGARVLGVDGSLAMLESARSRYPNIEFYHSTARRPPV